MRIQLFLRALALGATWLVALREADAARALYDFTLDGPVVGDPVVVGYSDDRAPALPNDPLLQMVNGAAFADANLFGPSLISDRLGSAGLVSEPVEPTSAESHYGFWANKGILAPLTDWTLLMWFNRRDLDNHDFLVYIGAGDGFGGSGAETYVYSDPTGALVAENWSTSTTRDMQIAGGQVTPHSWHQLGLVRHGAEVQLYLDGALLGTDSSVTVNSFAEPANSVVVFGAAKWMRLPNMRTRVFDGLVDQIEIYDASLSACAIAERYRAFAAPVVAEPSSLALVMGVASIGCSGLAFRLRGSARRRA